MLLPPHDEITDGCKGPCSSPCVQEWQAAWDALQHEKTWFWWADKQKRAVVRERKAGEKAARKVLQQHEKHIQGLLHKAKAELGLFSEAGVEEGRRLFWDSFQAGKVSQPSP